MSDFASGMCFSFTSQSQEGHDRNNLPELVV